MAPDDETGAQKREQIARLTFREVTRESWPDLELLFESRGGPHHCWCMVWRATAEERKETSGERRKEQLRRRVDEGIPVGIVGYLDGAPAAWCSIAPRESYRRIAGEGAADEDGVWSLACMFTIGKLRGAGVTARLVEGAVDHARSKGARVVEAYPVDPDSPSYRFMGFVPVFARAGFTETGRAGVRRHVMRLTLGPGGGVSD